MEELISRLLLDKPNNPNEYLLGVLKSFQSQKKGQKKAFFTPHDLEVMFDMFDIQQFGIISEEQFATGNICRSNLIR